MTLDHSQRSLHAIRSNLRSMTRTFVVHESRHFTLINEVLRKLIRRANIDSKTTFVHLL